MVVDCPICYRGYSQHLRVSHGVRNKEERKLLLSIPSGRVDVRKGTCPVLGCGKATARMDRHLKANTELTSRARSQAMDSLKRKKVLADLAKLRASDPAIPMSSMLDLNEAGDIGDDPVCALGDEEEEQQEKQQQPTATPCDNPRCRAAQEDLQKQVEILTDSLCKLSRRFRLLKRRCQGPPSSHLSGVAGKLLASCCSPGIGAAAVAAEEDDNGATSSAAAVATAVAPATASPSTSCSSIAYPFPDYVPALNVLIEEFRGHQEAADPGPRLVNNVASKVFRFKNFLAKWRRGRRIWPAWAFLIRRRGCGLG
ncbi:uncharacterized protein [Pseudorasbora parva]|uniref:uncharacterized protein n=1 Tax=Pseudorasbora parva TaxID=51549 RepID=UPI00351F221D